ncbi:MAG: 5-histidylcysteine sulfoxide synthase [Bacteroidetes bacterium]|nr:MAG: 5-histidylcysteine sulfoxide synthase [Bacteroidota bacterium]
MITSTINSKSTTHHPPKLTGTTKADLKKYFLGTWELYEMLFSSINDSETYYLNPDPLRNPLIFYWGHTAAFYINKLRMAGLIEEGINDRYEQLFAVGVDPDRPENLDKIDLWPTVEEVNAYRDKVYEIVLSVIDQFPDATEIDANSPWWSLMMGLEHDRIHFETSSVLFRQLPQELLTRPEEWIYAPTLGNAQENKLIKVAAGEVTLGKPSDHKIFGWDNEYGTLTKQVPAFLATKNLISNAEYLVFVLTGAYNDEKYWTPEGWQWKNEVNAVHPKFWVKEQDTFLYRTVFENITMPLDWPVEVNAHEAWAYCSWKGEEWRLMSEAEFTLIADEIKKQKGDPAFSGSYNVNFQYGSPNPVGFMDQDNDGDSFNDIYGNVWDWLSDDFYPLPGFRVHPHYQDFSEPFFDEDHSMLLGGAWASTGTGASPYYRLWFRRHFYQHAGFRLAKNG